MVGLDDTFYREQQQASAEVPDSFEAGRAWHKVRHHVPAVVSEFRTIDAFFAHYGPDAIDRLRDALEAIHGITLDRDKMARVCREARMELRPPLTREMVREAVVCAFERDKSAAIAWRDYSDPYTRVEAEEAEAFVTRLHAALTDGGRDG